MYNQITPLPNVLVSYPNHNGHTRACAVIEMVHYFAPYGNGSVDFFCEGVRRALTSDFPGSMEACVAVFHSHVDRLLDVNAYDMRVYDNQYRHFRKMVLEMWSYVRSSLKNFYEIEQYKYLEVLAVDYQAQTVVLVIKG